MFSPKPTSFPSETFKKEAEDIECESLEALKQEAIDSSDCKFDVKQEDVESLLATEGKVMLPTLPSIFNSWPPETIKKDSEDLDDVDYMIKHEEVNISDCESTIKPGVDEIYEFDQDECKLYNAKEIILYKCDVCPYQTKHKRYLKTHQKQHSSLEGRGEYYECATCGYRTVRLTNFRHHLLVHKKPCEVTMFKCNLCQFQSKRKDGLKNHQKQHSSLEEGEHYECATCGHLTVYLSNFKRHLLVHKKPCEVTMFKCDVCPYQTKFKGSLKTHQKQQHSSLKGGENNECATCNYKTFNLGHFKRHLLVHKEPCDVNKFKCDVCPYETKRKTDLKTHQKQHSSLEGRGEHFECVTCEYRTVRLSNLKQHLLVHKKASEVTMFKCDVCPYQTKRNICLKAHKKRHLNPDELKRYQCERCAYRCARAACLRRHVLVHKRSDEVTMYKCDFCCYKTKRKINMKIHQKQNSCLEGGEYYECATCAYRSVKISNFKAHLLVHKKPCEVTLFKCGVCRYQTKRRGDLRIHQKQHASLQGGEPQKRPENPSKTTLNPMCKL